MRSEVNLSELVFNFREEGLTRQARRTHGIIARDRASNSESAPRRAVVSTSREEHRMLLLQVQRNEDMIAGLREELQRARTVAAHSRAPVHEFVMIVSGSHERNGHVESDDDITYFVRAEKLAHLLPRLMAYRGITGVIRSASLPVELNNSLDDALADQNLESAFVYQGFQYTSKMTVPSKMSIVQKFSVVAVLALQEEEESIDGSDEANDMNEAEGERVSGMV
jgi:hypothetical protein